MINSAKELFLLTLIVVVGSVILQQNIAPQTDNSSVSHSNFATQCQQNANNSISNHSPDSDLLFKHASKPDTEKEEPVTITNCTSLSNILPAESDFSFNPGEKTLNLTVYNATLSSQIFVFQEPDPPRLGWFLSDISFHFSDRYYFYYKQIAP